MSFRANLIAKVVTDLGNGKLKIGTAYPIRQDVVITAHHVIPDLKNYRNTLIKWLSGDHEELLLSSPITELLYENESCDIAIVRCKTLPDISMVNVCQYPPASNEHWDSYGYPDAGIDQSLQVRKKVPAGGSYFKQDDDKCEMHLHIKGDAAETQLWRGMSGAPVFTVETGQLTAIISQVPNNERPDFKDRVYATSLSYLFRNCKDFCQAITSKRHCEKYIKAQQLALLDDLHAIKSLSSQWYEDLALHFEQPKTPAVDRLKLAITERFQDDSVQCIEALRLACEPYMSDNRHTCELLLLRMLALGQCHDNWSGHHLHDLSVRTRLLCELKVAARYQVAPQLKQLNKGEVAGLHALEDHSMREVGFDMESNAREQARSIAYHIYRRSDDEYERDEMTIEDWQEICEELATRRKGSKPELIRFELNASKESGHPLVSEEVQHELYKLLPELPVVLFGAESETNEKRLRAQVKVFYSRLDNP